MTQQAARSPHRLLVGIVGGLSLAGLVVVILHWREMGQVLAEADWRLVLPALLFTALSYACISYSFAAVNRVFGVRMGSHDLAQIGFVSTILNHVLSTGGAAGYSVRFLLMGRQGVQAHDVVATSLFAFYFSSLGMLALLPVGLVYLLLRQPMSAQATMGLGLGAVALVTVFALGTALVFVPRLRGSVLQRLAGAAGRVLRRDLVSPVTNFDETMTRGVALVKGPRLVLLVLLTATDWASSMLALWFCLHALGSPLGPGQLLTGFSLGITAGVLSMVPGGLGVQEGSMAGVYTLLGVPLQQAALAVILFRVVYYLIPYLVSLVFYGRLVRQAGRAGSPAPFSN